MLFALLLNVHFANAQGLRLSEKPEEFIKDVAISLATTQNPQAEGVAKNLENLWTNGKINDANKVKLASISNAMLKRGYKPAPTFLILYDAIFWGLTNNYLSAQGLENYLDVLKKTFELNDSKIVGRYLDVSHQFFANNQLYKSNYNRLYAKGGSISFLYFDQKTEINKKNTAISTELKTLEKKNDFDSWDAPIGEITKTENTNESAFDENLPQIISDGPAFDFKDVKLIIATAMDSVMLNNAAGVLSIKDGIWFGNGGIFSWTTTTEPTIQATLGNYLVEVKNPKITSDDASLNFPAKLNAPIKGIFEFLSKKKPQGSEAQYPRFMSYKSDVAIKGTKDFEYTGGFSVAGKRIFSSSVTSNQSTIIVRKDGKQAFKVSSPKFEISDSLLTSNAATFTSYFAENDSLFHPSLKLYYSRKDQKLRVSKTETGGFKDALYIDSYHKLEISADAMHWDLNSKRLDFYILAAKNIIPAVFESFDYYNQNRYDAITGQNNFNPLLVVSNYAKKNNLSRVLLSEMARSYQKDPANIRPIMLQMMQKGYMVFDPNVENLQISRKGYHYLMANGKQKDFDNLLIASLYSSNVKDSTSNATLNLTDNVLTIRGVKQFYLSDSLNAHMSPSDHQVKVGKDRSFGINGELRTGNFRFTGGNLAFDYQDFSVKLNKIDSITFIPQRVLAKGGKMEIGGDLKYQAGTIYINKPNNKAGRIRINSFPRLVIPTGVTAYFDHPYRAKGAYTRKVFFQVPSIDFDSLNVKDVDFAGVFHSDGIFPDFKETLIAMPDNSLGFSHNAPNQEYNIYGGKTFVKFDSTLIMDKSGLHSKGEIDHLTAQIQAKEMFFMPDSLTATGLAAQVNEGALATAYFTKVDIKNYFLKWQPKVDSMLISLNSMKGNFFDFYGSSTKLEGKLLLRSTGLFGLGLVKREDSETESSQIQFKKEAFSAESANIKIGNKLKEFKPALFGKKLNVDFDLTKGMVSINVPQTNNLADSSLLFFPNTAYRTSIGQAIWDINKKTISMNGNVANATFTSTEASQEGLTFNGSAAFYDITKEFLSIEGVPFIKSADAKIIPENGKVSIKKNAEMLPFSNAKLQVDTVNGYHNLMNGNIRVLSRLQFEGDASYRYVNSANDTINIKMQNFEFKEIANSSKKKSKSYSTFAKASLAEKDNFHISPKFLYQGNIVMIASENSLSLNGYVKADTKNRKENDNWIAYKGNNVSNADVVVSPTLKSTEDISLFAGWHFDNESEKSYTTFLSPKKNAKDEDFFLANGIVNDVPKSSTFIIADETKETKKTTYESSNYEYDDAQKKLKLTGKFNLFYPNTAISMAGFANIKTDSGSAVLDQMLIINLPLPAEALKSISEKFVRTNLDTRNIVSADEPADKDNLLIKLANLVGGKIIDPLEKKIKTEHLPLATINNKLNTTLVISKANLHWSDKNNTFYSVGNLAIANIGNTDINAEIPGYIEIRKIAEGDELYIYLAPKEDVWLQLGFIKNELGVVSSEIAFNNLILSKTKGDKKKSNNDYSFVSVGAEEKIAFVEHFEEYYQPQTNKVKKLIEKELQKVEENKKNEKEGF